MKKLSRSPLRVLLVVAICGTALSASAYAADPPLHVSTLAPSLDGAVGGVTVDSVGYVYVADFGQKVWRITPWGDVELFADSFYGSSGNTIDPQGNLLQSNFFGNTISRVSRSGDVSTFATGLNGPVGLAADADGFVYACNCRSNTISRISAEGVVTEFVSGDLFNCPNGITIDPFGRTFVANFSDGRVIKITKDGDASLFATIPGGGNGHVVAVGSDLYVTGFRANTVFRVDESGAVAPVAGNGRFGEQDGSGPSATFSTPNGIAYDATRNVLYTNDNLLSWPVRFEGRGRPKSSLRQIAFATLRELAEWKFENEGAVAMKDAIRAYRDAGVGQAHEFHINVVGYHFLQAGNIDAAITVLELNTELFPQSANTWDSLAEAFKTKGEKRKAIELYRKSLELNPGNQNAVAMLDELGSK